MLKRGRNMKYIVNVEKYKIESCKRRLNEKDNGWYHDMINEGRPLEDELEDIKKEMMDKMTQHLNGEYYIEINEFYKVMNKHISKAAKEEL